MTEELFVVITAHCIFDPAHTVTGLDPKDVHDRMETHYVGRHSARIAAIITGNR